MNRGIACSCGWTGRGVSGSPCPHGHGPTHWANDVCQIYMITVDDPVTLFNRTGGLPCEAVRVHDVLSSIQNNPGGLPTWLRGLQWNGTLVPRHGTTLLLRDMNGWIEAQLPDWIMHVPNNHILWLKSSPEIDARARPLGVEDAA